MKRIAAILISAAIISVFATAVQATYTGEVIDTTKTTVEFSAQADSTFYAVAEISGVDFLDAKSYGNTITANYHAKLTLVK